MKCIIFVPVCSRIMDIKEELGLISLLIKSRADVGYVFM